MTTEWERRGRDGLQMTRGAKFFVKGRDGSACGPFRWTTVREWRSVGYFTPDDEVRQVEETTWSRLGTIPALVTAPPGEATNEALNYLRARAREQQPVGPRAAAYLRQLGCPIPIERLNPYTAFQWIRIMEELRPQIADATERWAAEEESNGRVPSATAGDATPAQIETLRSKGIPVSGKLTRLDAQRLISGPPTEEQLERLNFYGVTLPVGACQDEARDLIDRNMRENWVSEEAFQASQRKQGAKGAAGQNPAPVLRLRPAPVSPDAEFGSTAQVRPAAPARSTSQAPVPPRRRPAGSVYVVVACLFALLVTGWVVSRKKSAADATRERSSSAETAAAGATPPVGVTLLESPNPANGEQLRLLVAALPLTGIVGGAEPRALIDGRMYRVGDVVDQSRGLVVLQIDPKRNLIAFGDAAGSIVHRVIE